MAACSAAILSPGRATLRRAFVLIDARHGAKEVDQEIMTLLDKSAVPFQVVMTKSDKLRGTDRETIAVAGARARWPSTRRPIPNWS